VCAATAPSMALSWKAHRAVDAPSDTIADGIAVRVPVPEAVALMEHTVDDVMLVDDEMMAASMRTVLHDAGLVVEPAGAAGLAAIAQRKHDLAGRRVAAILTGGNLTQDQLKAWLD